MLKGPVVILLLPHPGKSYTGEGSGRFEKLEKPAWKPKGRQLYKLEVCYLLKLNNVTLVYKGVNY